MPNYKGSPAIKQVNRRKSEGKSSKYFGVHYYVRRFKRKRKGLLEIPCWRVLMRQDGKTKHIGYFKLEDEDKAGQAYIDAASKFYGQPVRQNL